MNELEKALAIVRRAMYELDQVENTTPGLVAVKSRAIRELRLARADLAILIKREKVND